MRVFLEEAMFHFLCLIKAQPIGQHHLLKGVVKKVALVALCSRVAVAGVRGKLRGAFSSVCKIFLSFGR
jgi:hypothetical protein